MKTFILCLAYFLAGAWSVSLYFQYSEPTPAELQREYDAYRHCLQMAAQTRCQMTPLDFVRYYELKHEIEAANQQPEPQTQQ